MEVKKRTNKGEGKQERGGGDKEEGTCLQPSSSHDPQAQRPHSDGCDFEDDKIDANFDGGGYDEDDEEDEEEDGACDGPCVQPG